MAEIQFDEEQQYVRSATETVGPSGLIGLVQKCGLAKDDRQANYILLGIAVVSIALTVYFMFPSSPKKSSVPSPAELMMLNQGL